MVINFADLPSGQLIYNIKNDTWHEIKYTTGGQNREIVLKFGKLQPKFDIFSSTLQTAIDYETKNGKDTTKKKLNPPKLQPSSSETSVLLPLINVEAPEHHSKEENKKSLDSLSKSSNPVPVNQKVEEENKEEFPNRIIPPFNPAKFQGQFSSEENSSCEMERSLSPSIKPDNKMNLLMTLITELAAAIGEGHVQKAQTISKSLAENKAKLLIKLQPEHYMKEIRQQEFKVKFFVEDKDASEGPFVMRVQPTDTIRDLKNKMQLRFKYPFEVQRWIIGKRIPKDEDSLSKCGVKGEGHTLYLYLVSAKSVGITKQDMDRRMEEISAGLNRASNTPQAQETGDYMTMNNIFNPQYVTHLTQPASPQVLLQSSPNNTMGENKSSLASDPRPLNLDIIENIENRTAPSQQSQQRDQVGWTCPQCTLLNKPTWPGCEICSAPRPDNYKVPEAYILTEEEIQRAQIEEELDKTTREAEELRNKTLIEKSKRNFETLLQVDEQDLVPNQEEFECVICFETIPAGDGVILRDCLHQFCRDCLSGAVAYIEDSEVKCPYQDPTYSCPATLQEREIKALVPREIFDRFLTKGLKIAESQESNSYHCKTPDCPGWCIYEDHVNFFICPVCRKENCLTCKTIHEGMNCKQYQEDLNRRSLNDSAAKETQIILKKMLDDGDAMNCPQCKVIVQKKDGCDWIKCSICKTEICWVTRGPRWGPNGEGDVTGGCRCRVGGQKCHPKCNNCH